jgi:hypothetical protein
MPASPPLMLRLIAAILSLTLPFGCASMRDAAGAGHGGRVLAVLPTPVDPTGFYLFYLHGKLIEDEGLPAVSPEHGEYQYEAILERLSGLGFTVISEVRPRDADVTAYAERVVGQADSLLRAGVPPEHIAVVGASKGAYIAALASHLARNPRLRFVLLAGCSAGTVAYMREHGVDLYGDVLAIRDAADTELAGPCAEVFALSEGIGRHAEVVLDVGTGHGILYRPLDEWVLPTVEWARAPG